MTSICCRLCLLNGPNLQPIQDLTIASNGQIEPCSSDLAQLISRYLSIEPQSNSPFPVYICSECCNTIAKWHWFRESCLQNDAVYLTMEQKPEKDDEIAVAAEAQDDDYLNLEIKQEEIEIGEEGYKENLFTEPLAEKKPRKPRTKKSLPDKVEEGEAGEPPEKKKRGRPKLPPKKIGRPRLPERERNRPPLPKMCPLCGKMVMEMKGHIRMHNQDRCYQCEYCPKNFYNHSVYKSHVNVHTKEIKYTCPQCDKFFWRQETLKMHMNMHSEELNFKCPYCPKAYRMRAGMVEHRKTHTGPPDVQCFGCEKKFYTKTKMNQHARMHLEVKPYICKICQRGFTRKYYLRGHMEKDHPGVKEPEEAVEGVD